MFLTSNVHIYAFGQKKSFCNLQIGLTEPFKAGGNPYNYCFIRNPMWQNNQKQMNVQMVSDHETISHRHTEEILIPSKQCNILCAKLSLILTVAVTIALRTLATLAETQRSNTIRKTWYRSPFPQGHTKCPKQV